MHRLILAIAAAVGAALAPASAQAVSMEAFYGRWVGKGATENFAPAKLPRHSTFTIRDLDVAIAKREDGFEITWTTVIRRRGTQRAPKVKRKTTTLSFVATPTPGVFQSKGGPNPALGKTYAWARLEADSLVINILEIDKNGIYGLSRYVRTIRGTGKMELEYTLLSEGERLRNVIGDLERQH